MTEPTNPDPMLLALITELHTYEQLVDNGHLTDAGIHAGWAWATHPNQMTPHINASLVRERVVAKFEDALAASTGFPVSHWRDRPAAYVPDDTAGLDDGGQQ